MGILPEYMFAVPIGLCIRMHAHRGHERMLDPHGTGVQVALSCPVVEHWSSRNVARALTQRATLQPPC